MKNKKFSLIALFLILSAFRIAMIFTAPPEAASLPDPNQLGYTGLLKNSIIQLLFCISFIIMLGGFSYVLSILPKEKHTTSSNIEQLIFVLIAGLTCIAASILWINWTYIHLEFRNLISMLMYESYNPLSAPHMSYYQWKYSINPAKLTVSLLIVPVLLPLLYYQLKIRKQK